MRKEVPMGTLILFNLLLIALIALGLWAAKKCIKSKKGENILLLAAALVTILCHYSSLLYHEILDGSAMAYLRDNPNLLLPIYPCNVVMWSCTVYGLCRNKKSRFCAFLGDYIFWFGIVSTLVGMFANVDFIRQPTLADYDVTKGIVAHATLLFNVLLLPVFGHIRVDLPRNMRHILISIGMMFAVGMYCNIVFEALVSQERAHHVNSMFLIHSPFEGMDFLTYPVIALMALPLYFGLFAVCELFAYQKGNRFCHRLRKTRREKRQKAQ